MVKFKIYPGGHNKPLPVISGPQGNSKFQCLKVGEKTKTHCFLQGQSLSVLLDPPNWNITLWAFIIYLTSNFPKPETTRILDTARCTEFALKLINYSALIQIKFLHEWMSFYFNYWLTSMYKTINKSSALSTTLNCFVIKFLHEWISFYFNHWLTSIYKTMNLSLAFPTTLNWFVFI